MFIMKIRSPFPWFINRVVSWVHFLLSWLHITIFIFSRFIACQTLQYSIYFITVVKYLILNLKFLCILKKQLFWIIFTRFVKFYKCLALFLFNSNTVLCILFLRDRLLCFHENISMVMCSLSIILGNTQCDFGGTCML